MRAALFVAMLCSACELPSLRPPPPEPAVAPAPAPVIYASEPTSQADAKRAVQEAVGDEGVVLDVSCAANHCLVTVVGNAARSGRAPSQAHLEAAGFAVRKGRVTRVNDPEEWLWTLILSKGTLPPDELDVAVEKLAGVLDQTLRAYRPPSEGL